MNTDKFAKYIWYLRGRLTSFIHFSQSAWVCQVGKLDVYRKQGVIDVGEKVRFWPGVKLSADSPVAGQIAQLKIGRSCQIGDRTQIHCGEKVVLEDEVLISWDCTIMDRDYHAAGKNIERTSPVHIGKSAWLGCHVIVLKGVHIGEGAIIGAGSVVTRDIPAYCIAVGNPARVIRYLESASHDNQ